MNLHPDMTDTKLAQDAHLDTTDVAPKDGQFSAKKVSKHVSDAERAHVLEREQTKRKSTHEVWQDLKDSFSNLFLNLRHHAISATPRFFVNNSSNILGASHVATEVMMFKSSLPNSELVTNARNPIDYVVKAITRVFRESFSGSKTDLADMKVAMKGKPVSGFVNHILDMEGATERAVKANVGKLDKKGKAITRESLSLGNPWQTRSTLSGLIVWSLSALIPDKKESPDEIERMTVLQGTNMPKYIMERLRQAVWVPEWPEHKRQMIGLGIFSSGIFSLLGAWRNNISVEGLGKKYAFNGGYFCTAALTLISSIPLVFATDDQKGFGGFGSWMAGRMAFLPGSILRKFKGDKLSAMYYTGASVSFQAENLAQALVGGAEKNKDGSVVDHDEIKRRAHEEAEAIKQARRGLRHYAKPHTLVSQTEHLERVAAAGQEKDAAVVG